MKAQLKYFALVILIFALVSCTPAEPETIIKEVEVIVTQEVEVVVTQEVEVQVEVEVPAEITVVRVNMGYIPDVQYAPFYVGIEKGYFAEEGIQIITDYSSETDGIALLAAGEAQFAIGSGDLTVAARSQGLPVKFVARWYNGIPSAIVSPVASGIETPQDLVGKIVGIPGFFGINYKSYLSMLSANDLTSEDVQLEAVGWSQVASLTEGLIDAAVVYSNNEPVQLVWNGMEVNVMELRDWNEFVPIGIMTSEQMIAENPEVVQAFVRAFLRSLKATLDDPEFTLEAAVRAVGVAGWEKDKAGMALGKSLEFWSLTDDGKYGYYEVSPFDWTQEFLLAAGEIDTAIDTSECFTNEFVENAQP